MDGHCVKPSRNAASGAVCPIVPYSVQPLARQMMGSTSSGVLVRRAIRFGVTGSARGRGAFVQAPLASVLKVDPDSSDGEGGGADCVALWREHFDLAKRHSKSPVR